MFENDFGIHRDTVFRIKVKVVKVSKGKGIKPDEEILIEAWKPALRLPPLAGLQGHDSIPQKGDEITVFLKRKKDKVREPLLPNGIEIKKPNKNPNPKTVCPLAASAAK